ncbi:MAG: SagB/ThcOx family dehydrogenase [Candidatus Omnitrophica bacterium]|nr:SagB/ThcOx family dehydrogenase [Candidatus Omnitrophota bacterium]
MATVQDKKRRKDTLTIAAAALAMLFFSTPPMSQGGDMEKITLPKPKTKGKMSVEEAIQRRRSVRSYAAKEISLEDISQLLWACQGITSERGNLRSAPSAGALYPLEIYVAKNDGLFHYIPQGHLLEKVSGGDLRRDLANAAYGQSFVAEAPVDIIITAVHSRITPRYGDRGIRYTDMEVGHAAENLFLQAVALGLDSVAVGAFSDTEVGRILKLPSGSKPLYILPVGYKK